MYATQDLAAYSDGSYIYTNSYDIRNRLIVRKIDDMNHNTKYMLTKCDDNLILTCYNEPDIFKRFVVKIELVIIKVEKNYNIINYKEYYYKSNQYLGFSCNATIGDNRIIAFSNKSSFNIVFDSYTVYPIKNLDDKDLKSPLDYDYIRVNIPNYVSDSISEMI